MNKRRLSKAFKRIRNLPANKYFWLYATNKIRHFYIKQRKSTQVAYPSTIMLELTNRCNLHCTICPREYEFGQQMDKGNMDIALAKNIIDNLWPYLDSVGLTGMGETLLYPDIVEVASYIKSKNKGIIISISTNAVVPNFIDKVSPLINTVDTIQVSIDGVDDVYNSIRKGSSFDLLEKNLRSLSSLCDDTETTLMLNMVVTEENHTHMAKIVDFASEVGIKYVDFTLFNLAAITNYSKGYYEFYQSTEFKISLQTLEKVAKLTPNVTVTNKNFDTHNNFQKCPFPWSHFYITWDGYTVPCCAKPFPKEMNFGNVQENGVMHALNSYKYQNFRKMWLSNTAPSFCQRCHFLNIEPVK